MFNYKKQLIVNDKYGMFALIVFPFSDDSLNLNESHKYQFNSLKFIDKQNLSSSHNRQSLNQFFLPIFIIMF